MPSRNSSAETDAPTASVRTMRVPGWACSRPSRMRLTVAWVDCSLPCGSSRTSTESSAPKRWTPASATCAEARPARILPKSAGPGVRTSMTMPPRKSMPRCRPGWKNRMMDAIDSTADVARPANRPRMNLISVWSGTSRNSGRKNMGLDRQEDGTGADVPAHHEQPRHEDGGEHGGDDADGDGDREALHRAGAKGEQHDVGEKRGRVAVDDGAVGAAEPGLERVQRRAAVADL